MLYNSLLKVTKFFNKDRNADHLSEVDEKIIISILGVSTCFLQGILTYIEGLRVVSSLLFGTSVLVFILLLFFNQRWISEKKFSHASCVLFSALLISINLVSGILYSPSKIWIGLLPIFSIIYTGAFPGFMYTLISSLILFVCSIFYMNGYLIYNEFSLLQIQAMGTKNLLFAPMLYLAFFGYYFSKTKFLLKSSSHLAELGASYSLFVHEISKPLSRLVRKKEDFKQNKDLDSLFDLYSMMTHFNSESIPSVSIVDVNLSEVIQEILDKYSDYLQLYKITVDNQVVKWVIKEDRRMLYVLLDNIFRNAIENAVGFKGDYKIEILQNDNILTIKNPINPLFVIENINLLPVGSTTKAGHMGVGVFLIKKIATKLGLTLDMNISSKKFLVTIAFKANNFLGILCVRK